MGLRSFLAFELPPEIRETTRSVLADLAGASGDVKWVRPEGVHLTVVFLGTLDEGVLPDMKETVRAVARKHGPFRVSLKGSGFFPNRRRPRVVWIGLEGDFDRMGALRDELQESLAPFGIKQERRPFRPHLTLGRFRREGRVSGELERAVAGREDLSSPPFDLTELVLFKSDLRPGGALYTKLESFPLAGFVT